MAFTTASVKTHKKLHLLNFRFNHVTNNMMRDTQCVADRLSPGRYTGSGVGMLQVVFKLTMYTGENLNEEEKPSPAFIQT